MQEQELVNEIAKLVAEQLKNKDVYNPEDKIPIGVSARHVHLTHEDVETLFWKRLSADKEERADGRSVCITGMRDFNRNKAACY